MIKSLCTLKLEERTNFDVIGLTLLAPSAIAEVISSAGVALRIRPVFVGTELSTSCAAKTALQGAPRGTVIDTALLILLLCTASP